MATRAAAGRVVAPRGWVFSPCRLCERCSRRAADSEAASGTRVAERDTGSADMEADSGCEAQAGALSAEKWMERALGEMDWKAGCEAAAGAKAGEVAEGEAARKARSEDGGGGPIGLGDSSSVTRKPTCISFCTFSTQWVVT